MYDPGKMKKRRAFFVAIAITIAFLALVFIGKMFEDTGAAVKIVSGTEYISGESGQVIVQVSDKDGSPVEGYACKVTVLYPDKNYFMIDQVMIDSSEPGNYYKEFITPNTTGVYEENVRCLNSEENRTVRVSSSFHVSLALNIIEKIATNQTQQFNEVIQQFNQTREKLELLDRLINSTREELGLKINATKAEINESVNKKFQKLYHDIANASQKELEIFSAP